MPPHSPSVSSVARVDDELFFQHVAPPDHPERGDRLRAVREGLDRAAPPDRPERYLTVAATDATDEQLARVHSATYIEQLGHMAGRSGHLDADTYLSAGSIAAARRAAGAAVALVETLISGRAQLGIAVPRPPGHHALPDQAMGFCLLNNVAVAAAHARAAGRERVLVLDWDVHHGNGTEAMFYADANVLFMSLHQYPNYPGTGAASDLGTGDGRGRNLNIPLPAGGGDALYAAAFQRVVSPIIEQFAPDLALVSCGFDAHERDPLAEMALTSKAYGQMTRDLLKCLPEGCPVGVVLEGGYDLQALRESSEEVAAALFRPSLSSSGSPPLPALPPHAEDALVAVQREFAPFWRLS